MKREKSTVLIVLLFLVATCAGWVFQTNAQPPITTLSIKPPEITIGPGQEFTVDVNITDVQNMYAYEFKIFYLNGIVTALSAVRPSGHFMEPEDPTRQFIPKWEIKNNYNTTHGQIWLAFTLLAPERPRSGSGILVRITFKAVGLGSTLLTLKDTKLADSGGGPITHDVAHSNVAVTIPWPTIGVNPTKVSPTRRGEIIPVNVTIVDLDEGWKAVGFEFKLGYNSQLLKVVNVVEGPFLKKFGETYMTPPIVKPNYVHLGLILLPQEYGNWTIYPSGSGTLVTILFNVTCGPPVSADLTLYDTKIADITATPPGVPHNVVSGRYEFFVETLLSTIVWKDPATNETHVFTIQTISNSTINGITFIQIHRCLTFTVTGPDGARGFCNITIPKMLLDAKPEEWLILIEGRLTNYIAFSNETHTQLYFTYRTTTKSVYIFGAYVIPELPINAVLLALLFSAATAISIRKLLKFNGTNSNNE